MAVRTPVGGSAREALADTPHVGGWGDARPFDSFVRVHYRALLCFLRSRTNSLQEAEDVAQESVAKLLRYRDSVPASDWRQLLYRIAINASHDKFRDNRHHLHVVRLAIEQRAVAALDPDPYEWTECQEKLTRLRHAILRLPPKCQRVCLLRLAQGMRNVEIARHCGISVKMVEKHLTKGLAAMRREVGDPAADSLG